MLRKAKGNVLLMTWKLCSKIPVNGDYTPNVDVFKCFTDI